MRSLCHPPLSYGVRSLFYYGANVVFIHVHPYIHKCIYAYSQPTVSVGLVSTDSTNLRLKIRCKLHLY